MVFSSYCCEVQSKSLQNFLKPLLVVIVSRGTVTARAFAEVRLLRRFHPRGARDLFFNIGGLGTDSLPLPGASDPLADSHAASDSVSDTTSSGSNFSSKTAFVRGSIFFAK